MNGKLNDRDARCPFFAYHMKESVTCESLIPDTRAKIVFGKPSEKKQHYTLFCCFKYENCEMYRAIMRTYQEDDEKGDSLLRQFSGKMKPGGEQNCVRKQINSKQNSGI